MIEFFIQKRPIKIFLRKHKFHAQFLEEVLLPFLGDRQPYTATTKDFGSKKGVQRGWCTKCQNLREQQNVYHPQDYTGDVHHAFCGGGARIAGFDFFSHRRRDDNKHKICVFLRHWGREENRPKTLLLFIFVGSAMTKLLNQMWPNPVFQTLFFLLQQWADPGVQWKRPPEQWELWEGKPLKPYHFNRTLGAQKASSQHCQTSTAKQRELWEQNGL